MRTYDERLTALVAVGRRLALVAGCWRCRSTPRSDRSCGLLALVVPGVALILGAGPVGGAVRVEDGMLTAGPARIPVSSTWARARRWTPTQARAVRGPESDPAGYHLIRGWVPAGVGRR